MFILPLPAATLLNSTQQPKMTTPPLKFNLVEHEFKTTGKIEIKKGWREVLGKEKNDSEEQSLPRINQRPID